MTKSELRKLIIERFSQSELDSLMFDFCEKHPEVQYFSYVYGSYESQVSQLLLSLNDSLILKLEQFVYFNRPDICTNTYNLPVVSPNPNLYTQMGVRDAIVKRYKEQQLSEALFGFFPDFEWDKDIPGHLNYTNKVQELVKHFSRRNKLSDLVKLLGL